MPKSTLHPIAQSGGRFTMSPLHPHNAQNEHTPSMEPLKGNVVVPPRKNQQKRAPQGGKNLQIPPAGLHQQRLFCSPLETGGRHRRAFTKSPAMSPIDNSKSPVWFVCEPNGTIYPKAGREARMQQAQASQNPPLASGIRPSTAAKIAASDADEAEWARPRDATAPAKRRRPEMDSKRCTAEKPLETSFERILSKSLTPPASRTHAAAERSHLDDTLSVANILDANGLAHLMPVFARREIDMDMFFGMSETNLKRIGVEDAAERKQILEIIKGMDGNSSP